MANQRSPKILEDLIALCEESGLCLTTTGAHGGWNFFLRTVDGRLITSTRHPDNIRACVIAYDTGRLSGKTEAGGAA